MAQRTSDHNGNENLRASTGEQRIGMEANAREAHSADRAFHQNASVTHANAGVQMLDLDAENASENSESESASFVLAQATPGVVAAAGAAGGKVIGTIQLVAGDVKIMGLDGVIRVAQVGDKVFFKETILTGADGIIQIRLDNGQFVDVGRNAKLALDTDFFGYDAGTGLQATAPAAVTPGTPPAAEAPEKPAAPGADVAALQAAIARGQDPSQIAPATAAGGAPAAGGVGGDGGGGEPVVVSQANTTGPVTAGFQTAGASIAFPTPEFNLQPVLEGPPAISVEKTGPATIHEGGDSVTWHVRITNNSDSTDPVTVTSIVDDQLGDITAAVIAANGGNPIVLASGATFEFDYTPAGDVDVILNAGQTHTNVITVTAEDDEGNPVTGDDDHSITGTDVAPMVTIAKTAAATVSEGGDEVTYTFTITASENNASTDPVTVTAINDTVFGDLLAAAQEQNEGQPIVLNPGDSYSFTFTSNILLNAVERENSQTNVVTVTVVDDEGTPAQGTDEHTITGTDVAPTITVEKTGPATIAEGGADVTWSFTITNHSVSTDPVTVTAISDDKLGSLLAAAQAANGGQPIVLAAGASFTFTYNPEGNLVLDGGQTNTNVVTVTAVDDEGSQATDDDSHTITGTNVAPAITVEKSGPATIAEGGTDVTWTFKITNNSVSTDPVTVTAIGDDKLGSLLAAAEAANGGQPIVLAAGASFTFTYNPEGVVTIDGGQTYTNVVTVTAVDDEGSQATDDDSHTITGTNVAPAVHIEKSSATTFVNEGQTTEVTYTYTVTNTSSVGTDPLTITSLIDDNGTPGNTEDDFNVLTLGSVVKTGGDQDNLLEQGETWTYSVTRDVTIAEGGNSITNVAVVTALDNENTQATDDDDHTIVGDDVPQIGQLALLADEDELEAGNHDVVVGDDNESNLTGNLPINFGADAVGATISFADMHGD
ncbi:MAG: retention module-containing protein, partial [Candidatus Binatia bacterium]